MAKCSKKHFCNFFFRKLLRNQINVVLKRFTRNHFFIIELKISILIIIKKKTFSHACTEMATFLAEAREENPFFGVHTENAGVINNSRGNYQ